MNFFKNSLRKKSSKSAVFLVCFLVCSAVQAGEGTTPTRTDAKKPDKNRISLSRLSKSFISIGRSKKAAVMSQEESSENSEGSEISVTIENIIKDLQSKSEISKLGCRPLAVDPTTIIECEHGVFGHVCGESPDDSTIGHCTTVCNPPPPPPPPPPEPEREEPEAPEVPDQPDAPETPDTPDEPDTPDVPDMPDAPEVPDTPDVPETPEEPETPDDSWQQMETGDAEAQSLDTDLNKEWYVEEIEASVVVVVEDSTLDKNLEHVTRFKDEEVPTNLDQRTEQNQAQDRYVTLYYNPAEAEDPCKFLEEPKKKPGSSKEESDKKPFNPFLNFEPEEEVPSDSCVDNGNQAKNGVTTYAFEGLLDLSGDQEQTKCGTSQPEDSGLVIPSIKL